MFIGKWNPSVILTYIGVGFSIIGIYLSLSERMEYAISCLMIAGICDLFDGKIARSIKRNKEEERFGIELDSLVDVVSFLVFPIILLLKITDVFSLGISIFFAICGISRLAFFNILHKKERLAYFRGLPVTYIALILPIIYLLHNMVEKEIFIRIFQITFIGMGFLYILDIKIPKPRGRAYIFFSILALVMLGIYLRRGL